MSFYVGQENFPNVYICNIEVTDKYPMSDNTNVAKAKITMKINISDQLDYDFQASNVIRMIVSKSETFSNQLSQINAPATSLNIRSLSAFNNELVTIYNLPIPSKRSWGVKNDGSIFNLESLGTTMSPNTPHTVEHGRLHDTFVEIDLNTHNHLAVFVTIADQSLQTNGPMFAETIFSGGSLINDTKMFVHASDQSLWPGPVHYHNSGYMANSFHSPTSHPRLNTLNLKNYKLKDLRGMGEVISLPRPSNDNGFNLADMPLNYIFTDVLHTQSSQGKFNFLFGINMKNLLRKTCFIGERVNNIPEETFNTYLPNIRIQNLKIKTTLGSQDPQLMISCSDGENSFAPTFGHFENQQASIKFSKEQQPQKTLASYIEEVLITESSEIRFFNCQISADRIDEMKIQIAINDPIRSQYTNIYNALELSLSNLNDYRSQLERSDHYNTFMHKTTQKFINTFNNGRVFWLDPIINFFKLKNLLQIETEQQANKHAKKLFKLLNPSNTQPSYVSKVIMEMQTVRSTFVSLYPEVAPTTSEDSKSPSSYAFPSVGVEKIFEIGYRKAPDGLQYLETESSQGLIGVMTVSEFQASIPPQAQSITFNSTQNVNQASLESINSTEYESSYLSPKSLVLRGEKINLSEALIEQRLKEQYKNNFSETSGIMSQMGVQVYLIKDDIENLSDAVDYLMSSDSIDNNDLDNQQDSTISNLISKIQQGFDSTNRFNSGAAKLFNLEAKSNALMRISQEDAKFMPLAHKQAFLNQETSLYEDRDKFLTNEIFKRDLFLFNLAGMYANNLEQTDMHGDIYFIKDSKAMLTANQTYASALNNPSIVSLQKYNNDWLSMFYENSYSTFGVINSIVVLLPDNFQRIQFSALPMLQIEESINSMFNSYSSMSTDNKQFEYCRSLIVAQSPSRDPIYSNSTQQQSSPTPQSTGQSGVDIAGLGGSSMGGGGSSPVTTPGGY